MKNLPFVLICILIYSCGGNQGSEKEATINTELTYSLDTVIVDSGEEFLHLNENLFSSDLSADGRFLFNWNREASNLEKIDLDELRMVKKIKYEEEGPDGVGAFVFNYANTPDDNMLFWSNKNKGVWDQNGKLLRALPIDKLLEGTEHTGEVFLSRLAPIPNETDKFLTFYRKWRSNDFYFLIFDFSDDSFRKIELPELKKLSEFEVTMMYEGQWMGSLNAGAMQSVQNNKIILGLNSFNQAYIYDLVEDSLYFKIWDGPLVGSKQTGQFPKEVEAEGSERAEVMRQTNEQINYGSFVWDKENKKYYRFSSKSVFGDEMTEFETYKPIGADVYLSIFDEDFNLIAESKIPEIQKRPAKHFAKDGKIWLFENIDDELAFVRITIN